jgi:hypothetical protein
MALVWTDVVLGAVIGGAFGLSFQACLDWLGPVAEAIVRWPWSNLRRNLGPRGAGSWFVGTTLAFVAWAALLVVVVLALKPLVAVWSIYARSVLWALLAGASIREIQRRKRLRL